MGEQLLVGSPSPAESTADFPAWVRDYQRPLLGFAQLIAGDPHTGEDLLQTALARAYLKWSKIGAAGQDPVSYVRRHHRQRERVPVAARLETTRETDGHTARAGYLRTGGFDRLSRGRLSRLSTDLANAPRSRCASMPI